MGTKKGENSKKDENSKKNLFKNITSGMGKVADVAGKGARSVGNAAKTVAGGIGSTAKKAIDIGADIAEKQRIKSKNNEIDAKILEHKYNIGKYIYDNGLEIDDGIVISTINTIDRLVDEITELEGKKNG